MSLATLTPAAQHGGEAEIEAAMLDLGRRARAAMRVVALAGADEKNAALAAMAAQIRARAAGILAANAAEVARLEANGTGQAFVDRARLDPDRIAAVAAAVEAIAALDDPVGTVLAAWERPNGLRIERVRVPLGGIGVIYESRPNVTADAAALAVKAGNAVILRSGSDTAATATAIAAALRAGLERAGLPADAIQMVPTQDRAAVGLMLKGLGGAVDVIVPRGGKALVARVEAEARVPVFAHLEGICHVYVHAAADPAMAVDVVVNSKMRRTGICGAAETLLVDRAVAATLLPPIAAALTAAGCALRADPEARAILPAAAPATEADWTTEYLDAILSVAVVDGPAAAIGHVNRYGSHHTDAIVTDDAAVAERFLGEVDSAIVLHNASTQFADGGEFGMGAEIGIATGRMHARGPVGVEQLTSFNYRVRGAGQTRP